MSPERIEEAKAAASQLARMVDDLVRADGFEPSELEWCRSEALDRLLELERSGALAPMLSTAHESAWASSRSE